ncbi:MAG: hypothetical protein PUB07_03115, partial [Clostridia bacterium]|nr:hypothetical protein [Clostridia bacterium]
MDYSWLEVGDFVLIQSGTQRAAGQILRLSEEQIIIKQADGFKAMFRLDQVSSIVQVDGEKLAALNEVSAPAPTPASAFIPAPAVDTANTFAAHYAAALAKIESMPLPPKISEESFLEYDGIKRNYPQFYASYQSACTSVFYAKKNDRSSLDDKVKPAVAQFKTMYQETHEPYLLQLIAYLHFLRTDVGDGFTYAMHQLGEYRNSQASFDFYVSNGRLPGAISLWREFIGAPHVMLHAIQQPYPHSLVKGQQMSACLTDMMQSPLADRNAVHLIIYALYKRLVPAETAYSFDDYAISDTEAVNRMYESLITVLNTGTGIATVLGEIPNTRNYEVITLTNTLAVLEHAPYALSPGDIIHFSANGVPGHYSFVQINRREDVKRSNLKKVQKALVKDHAPQNLIAKVNRLIANVQPTPKPRGNTNNHSAITKAIQSARTMEECEQVTRKIVNLLEGSTCSESEKKAHVKDLISIRLRKTILDYDGAIAYAEKYRTQFDFSKDEQLQIDRLLVPAYIGKQEYRKAISLLETLTRDQFVLQDLIKLSRCHLQLKEYRICIEHCRRVLFYEKKGIPDIGAAYTCMFAAYIGMGEEHYDDAERTLADYQVVCSNLQKIEHMRTMLENAKAGVTAEPQIENLVDAATGDQVYTTPYLDYILKSTGYMRLSPAEFDTAIGKFVWEPSGVEEAEKFYTRLSETTVFKNNRLNEGDFGMVWETKMDMIRIASYCLTSFKEEEEAFYAEWAKRYLESAGHFMWLSYKKKILELNPLVGTCAFFALECLQMYSQLPATEFLKFPEFYDALNMYIVYSMGFKKGTFHAVQVKKKNVFKEADIAAAWDAIESNFSKMFQNEKLYAGAVKVLVRLLYYCRPLMPIIMKIIKKIGKEYVVRTQIMGVVERSYENAESLDQLFEKYFSEFRRNKNRFDTIMEEIRTCAEEEDRSAAGIRKSLETLLHFLENTNGLLWSPLDIERCRSLANILAKYCDLHNLNNYELKQENYRTIKMDSDANEKDFATNPSELSFGILQSILAIIRKAVTEESNALTQESLPVISIQNEYEEEGYWPKSNQSIDVMLLIYNGKGGEQCTPASNFFIDIAVGEDAQRFCNLSQTHFAEDFTLRGGESASVPIPLPLTHEGVTNEKPFVMTVSVSYKNVNGETTSITQEMNIRVKSRDEYKVIPNPYSPGPLRPGTENAKLFQGRDEAVDDLCNRILSGNNGGKTVLIYGQFRSGKSTLMNFLADKLKR